VADDSVSRGPTRASTLPTDPKERKKFPIASGVLDYFPDAIVAIAHLSYKGNEQHNPGQPLHWAREKSTDQDDTIIRHFMERGSRDTDGERHSTKLAWRALALLQLEIERDQMQEKVETTEALMPGEVWYRRAISESGNHPMPPSLVTSPGDHLNPKVPAVEGEPTYPEPERCRSKNAFLDCSLKRGHGCNHVAYVKHVVNARNYCGEWPR
jgi:hypothetical protein